MNVAFCRNLIVQLAHRTAAEVPRILVFRIDILDLLIDLLKIGIADDRLAAQNQLSLVRDFQGNIFKHFCIVRDNLSDHAVSTGDGLCEGTAAVRQNDGQTVHLPGQQRFVIPDEAAEHFHIFRFIKGKHRRLVRFFRQFVHRLVADFCGRASGECYACFFL